MPKILKIGLIIVLACSGCASSPKKLEPQKVSVVPESITNQEQYEQDVVECHEIAQQYDLSDKKVLKKILGAGIGGAGGYFVTGSLAGLGMLVGAVPVGSWLALSAIGTLAGAAAGAKMQEADASQEELRARQNILYNCLDEKGYDIKVEK